MLAASYKGKKSKIKIGCVEKKDSSTLKRRFCAEYK